MKALFVSHCNDLSGANKSFVSLIEKLKDRLSIVVLCNCAQGKLTDYLSGIGVNVMIADYAWWYIKPRKNPIKQAYRYMIDKYVYKTKRVSDDIIRLLKKEQFDFVYTNTSTVDVGARIATILGIPHIWHIREFGKQDFEFIPILSEEEQNIVFQSSYKIITISDALKKEYAKRVAEDKLIRIYNGLEIDSFLGSTQHDININNGKTNIIITGQVCSGKGQEQAILAVDLLRKDKLDVDLYIAGDVDYSYLNPILKKIGGEKSWLHILGMRKDIYELRNQMDIELVCSRSEAFGRVTLEAMLHGIPVIGSNAGGTPELIEDHVTGILFEYGNYEELAARIKELIFDETLYVNIVKEGKIFASDFTIDRTADLVYEVFQEVERSI